MPSQPIRCAAVAALLTALVVTAPQAGAQAPDASCQNPQTQADMNRCAGAGYAAQDRKLNQVYAAYRARLPAAQAQQLAAAQKAWIAFRDADCAFVGSSVAGGSVYGMVLNGCLEDRTRQRVKELEALAACKEGDLACPAPK